MDAQHEVGQTLPIQRRDVPRFLTRDVLIEVEAMKNNIMGHGDSVNVSKEGICGTFDTPLPLSERVHLKMKFPDNEQDCICKGRVMWGTSVGGKQFTCGIGLLELENVSLFQLLSEYMETHSLKLAKDERRVSERRSQNSVTEVKKRKSERRITKPLLKKCVRSSRINLFRKQKVFFREFSSVAQPRVMMGDKEVICFSYCNYLGLNNDEEIKKIMKDAIDIYGTTTTSSPTLGGTMNVHKKLEQKLTEIFHTEDAITYPMGYLANQGCISALIDSNDWIIVDEKSHASIIDGCLLSKGKLLVYRHNDMDDLKKQLMKGCGGKLIITDGVFSMDGDIAHLDVIYDLAEQYGACIMVDDAHGIGVLGRNGGGTIEHFGLEGKIDIVMGTLSKAIPLMGGFIAGKKTTIEYLRWHSRTFIFTMSLPPYFAITAMKILDMMKNDTSLRERLWANIRRMKEGLQALGYDIGTPQAAIIPISIRDYNKACMLSKELEQAGIMIDSVLYPAVKKSESRLRLVMTACHNEEIIDTTLNVFARLREQIGI